MSDSTRRISPLRQRMIEDMTLRKLEPRTQTGYIRAVKRLVRFLGRSPDTASAEELRGFQLHLVECGASPTTINATITALRFFFDATVERPQEMKKMHFVRVEQRLPTVLSMEEAARLLASAVTLKHQAALSVTYGARLRAGEVVSLKVNDIDSQRAHPRRARQRAQGPQRDALAGVADVVTFVVA